MNLILAAALAAALATTALPAAAQHSGHGSDTSQSVASGSGKVNSVDAQAGKLNITHGPIEALKWPGMTMDFVVLPGTDLSGIKAGDVVTFSLGRAPDGLYAIDQIKK